MRDSDRPEARQGFEQLAQGRRRMELHDYETRRKVYTDAGGQVAP